jgi:hypothetical protein
LPERLKKGLLGKAKVLTGEQTHGSQQWSSDIRRFVKGSDLVVADITTPRRDVYVEIGWAIGAEKKVLLGVLNEADRRANPAWTRARQIRTFASDTDFNEFLRNIVRLLDEPQDRISNWIDDPSNEPLRYRARARNIAMIGRGPNWSALTGTIASLCKENGFNLEQVCLENADEEGGILFTVIRAAKKAGTALLVFDGRETDLLACVAGGVFTTSDQMTVGKQKMSRKLVLLDDSGESATKVLPGLLRSKPGVSSYTDFRKAVTGIGQVLSKINGTLSHQKGS